MRGAIKIYCIITLCYFLGLYFAFRHAFKRRLVRRHKSLELGARGSYVNYKIIRLNSVPQDSLELLIQLVEGYNDHWEPENENNIKPVEFWSEHFTLGKSIDIVISPKVLGEFRDDLKKLGLRDLHFVHKDILSLMEYQVESSESSNRLHNMSFDCFHPIEDFQSYLDFLQDHFQDSIFLEDIGASFENRRMTVAKICKGGCHNDRPAIWIDAGIHGEEWLGPATAMFIIKELIENNDAHPHMTDKLDWYILPVVNPDGFSFSMTNESHRLWHKSRSQFSSIEEDCLGVDLNQNFEQSPDDILALNYPCSHLYQGPEPFSEVEVKNLIEFVSKQKIKLFSSLHAFGENILLPWRCGEEPKNSEKVKTVAEDANAALHNIHGKEFSVVCVNSIQSPFVGGSWLWASNALHIPYSFGISLRDKGENGYLVHGDQIVPSGEEVWAFHQRMAEIIIAEN